MARAALSRRWTCGFLLALACGDAPSPSPAPRAEASAPTAARSEYVGADACHACHAETFARWRGSDHDRAMEPAGPETVLGDFSDARLEHHGQTFRFEREGDRYWIHTAGADGEPTAFEVAYTFGIRPLQQYLVALPGGRLQAVSAAWDTRPAAEGGQRWIHLPADEPVPPGDPLHWTGLAGSWNAMCAECHSTGLEKGYDPEQRVYAPRWSEVDVACEACHGPGSRHVTWAHDPEAADDDAAKGLVVQLSDPHTWRFVAGEPIARRVAPERAPGSASPDGGREIETCAPCHSRRSQIADAEPGAPFLDAYVPALIEPGLYHWDGQIDDEVYVWGSFVQSRMHAAGVVCSDCHDPHALAIEEPDAVCSRCHRPEVFASPSHHHHAPDSTGASCVACHMPSQTYMVVDARRDHGFRVPRPDLSVSLGVPNPCTGCHADRDAVWAAAAVARWRGGPPEGPHFGEVLHAASRRAPGASADLAALARESAQPAIVRASALRWLGARLDAGSLPALVAALEDREPLVRLAAAAAGEALAPADRIVALAPRLRDPVRAVRIEAARALAPLAPRIGSDPARGDLAAALDEYRAAQMQNADRPEARTNLGTLAVQQGDLAEARRQYEAALRVGPFFVPAYVNLAEVYRQEGREDEAERVLRRALERIPDAADAHHALGLLLVRTQRTDEALVSLGRAVDLDPDVPRYAYVYGIALHSVGDGMRAIRMLDDALRRHPTDAELLLALATLQRDAGDWDAALDYARRLQALRPEDPDASSLVRQLERAAAEAGGDGSSG